MRLLKPLIVKNKKELVDILKTLLPLGSNLGFSGTDLPDKKWLYDTIHSLKPDHEMFNGESISSEIVINR